MSSTGLQILQRMARKRRELAFVGKATGGTTTTCIDTTRLRGDTQPADYFGGDAWIYVTSGNNAGFAGKIDQFSGLTGTITFSPAAGNVMASGDTYVVFRHGLLPDEWAAARDRGLGVRCTMWRPRPLSVLAFVEDWTGKVNGDETLAPAAMGFPDELAQESQLVTNATANGGVKSESYYVQPGESYRLSGDVSVRSGTGKIRVRRITAPAADIDLNGTQEFTLRGWQRFDVTFSVPSGCEEIQVWATGEEASAVVEWANVALIPQNVSRFNVPAAVLSDVELAEFFMWAGPTNNSRDPRWVPLDCDRHRSGALVALTFAGLPANAGAIWYQYQHHYAALQSDYLAVADRTTGDGASTDCPLDYAESAAVVEFLENRAQDPVLNKVYLAAEKDLGFYERKFGARPIVIEEQVPVSRRPYIMPLR